MEKIMNQIPLYVIVSSVWLKKEKIAPTFEAVKLLRLKW